jgi:hypothetical protein
MVFSLCACLLGFRACFFDICLSLIFRLQKDMGIRLK